MLVPTLQAHAAETHPIGAWWFSPLEETVSATGLPARAVVRPVIPDGWLADGDATVTVDATLSELAVDPTLTVLVNGVRQTSALLEPGSNEVVLAFPGSALDAGSNTVELEFWVPLRIDDSCRDPRHPERRVTLAPSTRVEFPLRTAPLQLGSPVDALLPTSNRDAELVLALPADATGEVLTMAAKLRAAVIDEAEVDVATRVIDPRDVEAHAGRPMVVFTEQEAADAPASMVTRPVWNRSYPVLELPMSEGLQRVEGVLFPGDQLVDRAASRPWAMTLADLGYGDRAVEGGPGSLGYSFDLPVTWGVQGASVTIHAVRSVTSEATGVSLLVNGRDVASLPFDDDERISGTDVEIPSNLLRPGQNFIRFEFDLDTPAITCGSIANPNDRGTLMSESEIVIDYEIGGAELDLADLPYALREPQDRAATRFIVPDTTSGDDLAVALEASDLLGGGEPMRMVRASAVSSPIDGHLIVWTTRDAPLGRLPDIGARRGGARGGAIALTPSTWAPDRVVLAVIDDPDASQSALTAIIDPALSFQLSGSAVSVEHVADAVTIRETRGPVPAGWQGPRPSEPVIDAPQEDAAPPPTTASLPQPVEVPLPNPPQDAPAAFRPPIGLIVLGGSGVLIAAGILAFAFFRTRAKRGGAPGHGVETSH